MIDALRRAVVRSTWRARVLMRRCRLGALYALGMIRQEDALDLLYDAEQAAGVHALGCISAAGVADRLREDFEDGPELEEAAWSDAARVASKWDSDGESASSAIDWACDIAGEAFTLTLSSVEPAEGEAA